MSIIKEATTTVPKYVTMKLHTDAFPYEVIEVISDKTIVVRSMKSTLDPDWKPEMHPGGFAAHCSNQRSQRWTHESDPDGKTFRLRRKKHAAKRFVGSNTYEKYYQWGYKGQIFEPADKPYRFHDYNF